MPRVQHIVLVKFKDHVNEDQIADAFAQLANLQEVIPGILHYGAGPLCGHEGLNQGYTHGFLMTFRSVEARDAYHPHPAHVRVKDNVLPLAEAVLCFDFED